MGTADGPLGVGQLNGPKSTYLNVSTGLLYVADEGNNRIRVVNTTGNCTLSTLAGSLTSAAGFLDAQGTSALLRNPTGVCQDPSSGTVLVADYNSHRIRRIEGTAVSTLAGTGTSGFSNGIATSSLFSFPYCVTALAGTVYATDASPTVRVISGGLVSSIGAPNPLSSTYLSGWADGPCSSARMSPRGLLITPAAPSTLYVAEMYRVRVITLAPACSVSTLAGSGQGQWVDGLGTAASFNNLQGISLDALGYLYLGDSQNQRLRRVSSADGSTVTLLGGGAGQQNSFLFGYTVGGTGTSALFNIPRHVSVTPDGTTLYVADGGSGYIRVVSCPAPNATTGASSASTSPSPWPSASGTPTASPSAPASGAATPSRSPSPTPSPPGAACAVATLAGTPGLPGSLNGPAATATLANVSALAVNASGAVFALEAGGHCVRVYTPGGGGGRVSLLAGGPGLPGFVDSPTLPLTARFNAPLGLCSVAGSNATLLYIGDTGNNAVRLVTLRASGAVAVSTTAGSLLGTSGSLDGYGNYASLSSPTGLACDTASSTTLVFIADTGNSLVRVLRATGYVSTLAGSQGVFAVQEGTGVSALFNAPRALLLEADSSGLLVADASHRLRRLDVRTGQSVTVLNASAAAAAAAAWYLDGPAYSASLVGVTQMAWGAGGALLLADGSALRSLSAAGQLSTLAGGAPWGAAPVTLDGSGAAAAFAGASGLAVHAASGAVYVGERSGCVLRGVVCAASASGSGTPSPSPGAPPSPSLTPTPTPLPLANACTVSTLVGLGRGPSVDGPAPAVASLSVPITGLLRHVGSGSSRVPQLVVAEGSVLRGVFLSNGSAVTLAGLSGVTAFVDGPALAARFNNLYGVAADSAGNLYISDHNNHAIRALWVNGSVTTLSGNGTAGLVNGACSAALFFYPGGLLATEDGSTLLIADSMNGRLRVMTLGAGGACTVATLAGSGAGPPMVDSAVGSAVNFGVPRGLRWLGAAIPTGAFLVADSTFQAVRVVNASTGGTTTLLGVLAPGSPGTGYVDGAPAQARLNYPSEALLHPVLGYVIAESGNNALRVLDAGGLGVSTLVGPGGPTAAGFADGPAPLARLRSPTGLVLGPDNATIYVFDSVNHAIRVVSCGAASASASPQPSPSPTPPPGSSGASCTTTTVMGGSGQGNVNADTGLGAKLSLMPPGNGCDLAFGPNGMVYISDSSNNAVKALYANGTSVTLASAGYNNPTGLAVNAAGDVLYIVGFGGQRIHALNLTTRVSVTLAGSGSLGYVEGGPGVSLLRYPYAIVLNPSGSYAFFSDRDNHRIRTIALPSGVTALFSGTGTAGSADGAAGVGQYSSPRGLAYNTASSILYVSDNHRIRAAASDGSVTTLCGSATNSYGDSLSAGSVLFNTPAGLSLDPTSGLLLVADSANHLIRTVSLGTGGSARFLGSGATLPYSPTAASAGTATAFNQPAITRLAPLSATPGAPLLYFTLDTGNQAVRLTTCMQASSSPTPSPGALPSLSSTPTPTTTPTALPLSSPSPTPGLAQCSVTTLAGSSSSLLNASALAPSAAFPLYFYLANTGAHTILSLNTSSPAGSPGAAVLALLAGQPGVAGASDGAALGAASFWLPAALAGNASASGEAIVVADTANHIIRRIAGGVVTTIAGTAGSPGFADATTGTAALFSSPAGLAVDSASGVVYIADTGNHLIRRISPWFAVTTLAGNVTVRAPSFLDSISPGAVLFSSPRGLALRAGSYSLFVADSNNSRIRSVSTQSGATTTLAGTAPFPGATGAFGTGALASGSATAFWGLWGLALDAAGTVLYTVEAGNGMVRAVSAAGGGAAWGAVSVRLAGLGSALPGATVPGGVGSADGSADRAQFNSPRGLAAESAPSAAQPGAPYTLLVADTGSSSLRRVSCPALALARPFGSPSGGDPPAPSSPTGSASQCTVSTAAGSGATGSADAQAGSAASFNSPKGVAVCAATGTAYVADEFSARVRTLHQNGTVELLAGWGAGLADGVGSSAAFRSPTGVACDPSSSFLYVVDYGANAVRLVFLSNRSVVTVGGNGTAGYLDGPGSASMYSIPYAAAATDSGVAVADFGNHRVRLITLGMAAEAPLGAVTTTLVGKGNCASVDGPLASAQVCGPRSLAYDSARALLYLSETGNGGSRVRCITQAPGGGTIVTLAGSFGSGYLDAAVGTLALLWDTQGLVLDPLADSGTGALLLVDTINNRIRRMSLQPGYAVTTVAGSGRAGREGGVGTAGPAFNFPRGLALDAFSSTPALTVLYVADSTNNMIRRIVCSAALPSASPSVGSSPTPTPSPSPSALPALTLSRTASRTPSAGNGGSELAYLAGQGGVPGFYDSAVGTSALLLGPRGLVTNGSAVLFADSVNHRVRSVALGGTFPVTTLAGSGAAGFAAGPALAGAALLSPEGLALSADRQSLYISDTGSHALRVLAGGTVSVLAGQPPGAGWVDAANPLQAALNLPTALALDGARGVLYCAERGNSDIRALALGGGGVSTVAGHPLFPGFRDGRGTLASFLQPSGLAISPEGETLFVSDTGNHLIRAVSLVSGSLGGTVSTLTGGAAASYFPLTSGPGAGFVDGTPGSARFNAPRGLALCNATVGLSGAQPSLVLLVADLGSSTIRTLMLARSNSSGSTWVPVSVATLAGNAGLNSWTNGALTNPLAGFYQPWGVACPASYSASTVAAGGGVLIAEAGSNLLRSVSPPTGWTGGAGVPWWGGAPTGANSPPTPSAGSLPSPSPSPTPLPPLPPNPAACTMGTLAGAPNCPLTQVLASGVYTTSSSSGVGGGACLSSPIGLALNPGNPDQLYVSEQGSSSLRVLTRSTGASALAAGLPSGVTPLPSDGAALAQARFLQPSGLSFHPSPAASLLYIVEYGAHRVRSLDTAQGTVSTVAGPTSPLVQCPATPIATSTCGFADAGAGASASALFWYPNGVAGIGGQGLPGLMAAVADYNNHRVRLLWGNGSVSSLGTGVSGSGDGLAALASFSFPQGLAYTAGQPGSPYPAPTLIVADYGSKAVRLVRWLAGVGGAPLVSTLGPPNRNFAGLADGPAAIAVLGSPFAVALEPVSGAVYVSDASFSAVRALSPSGTVTTLGGNPGFTSVVSGQQALMQPRGLALDAASGALYVADIASGAVRVLVCGGGGLPGAACQPGTVADASACSPPSATPSSSPGPPSPTPSATPSPTPAACAVSVLAGVLGVAGNADGAAGTGLLSAPTAAVWEPVRGSLAIVDRGNNRVRRMALGGGSSQLSTLAGSGVPTSLDSPLAQYAGLNSPQGICATPNGTLVIVDTGSHKLRLLSAAGTLSTLAGGGTASGATAGYADAIGAAALFNAPLACAVTLDGATVYVAEATKIRAIALGTGAVTTVAGTNQWGLVDGATGASALIGGPMALALHPTTGLLYITGEGGCIIRSVAPAQGGATATLFGSPPYSRCTGQFRPLADGDSSSASLSPSVGGALVDPSGTLLLLVDAQSTLATPAFPALRALHLATGVLTTLAPLGVVGVNVPRGLALDAVGGRAFVLDSATHTVSVVACAALSAALSASASPSPGAQPSALPSTRPLNGCVLTTLAGLSGQYGTANAVGAGARFNSPYSLVMEAASPYTLYVADYYNHVLRAVTPLGSVSTYAGTMTKPGYLDAVGTAAYFNQPKGLCLGPSAAGASTLFVVEQARLRAVAPGSAEVSTLAGGPRPAQALSLANGLGTAAVFYSPSHCAADAAGSVYVTDAYTVRRVAPSGAVSTLAGAMYPSFASLHLDGTGAGAHFEWLYGIALLPSGDALVVGSEKHLRSIVLATAQVTTLSGAGGVAYADGSAGVATYWNPGGLAFQADGTLLVSDSNNHVLRAVNGSGWSTLLAGTPTVYMTGSGPALGPGVGLNNPSGIAVTPWGDVLVADTNSHVIRRLSCPVSPSTTPTPSGTGSGTATGSGTSSATATVSGTSSVTVTVSGTSSVTVTVSGTASSSLTGSGTGSATATVSATPSGTDSATDSSSSSSTGSATGSSTPSRTASPTPSASPAATPPPTLSPGASASTSPTGSPTGSNSGSTSGSISGSGTPSGSGSGAASSSPSATLSQCATLTGAVASNSSTASAVASVLVSAAGNGTAANATVGASLTANATVGASLGASANATAATSFASSASNSASASANVSAAMPGNATAVGAPTPSTAAVPSANATAAGAPTPSAVPSANATAAGAPTAGAPSANATAAGAPTVTAAGNASASLQSSPGSSGNASANASAGLIPGGSASAPAAPSPSLCSSASGTGSSNATGGASVSANGSYSANATGTQTPALALGASANSSSSGAPMPSLTLGSSASSSSTLTLTASPTGTPTGSLTAGASASTSSTGTLSASPTGTPTGSLTLGASASSTSTSTLTSSPTGTPTGSLSSGASPSATSTGSLSSSPTGTPTAFLSAGASPSASSSGTLSASPTATATPSLSAGASPSSTPNGTLSGSPTATHSGSLSVGASPSGTAAATPSDSATASPTGSLSVGASPSLTPSASGSATPTPSPTGSLSVGASPSGTASPTPTLSLLASPSASPSASPGSSASPMPPLADSSAAQGGGGGQVMPGGTALFAAGAAAAGGLAVILAVLAVRRRWGEERRASQVRALAHRRSAGSEAPKGSSARAMANPLLVHRGKAGAPLPPRGRPPAHSKLNFAQYHQGK